MLQTRVLERDGGHLSSGVAVVVLVLVPQGELLWVGVLDQVIGHLLTNTLKENSSSRQTGRRRN